MTPAKAILFDFGGTLDADGVPWKDRMRRLCHDEGILGNAEPFDPIFYAADDALVGTIPASLPLRDTVRQLVAGVMRGLRVDDASIAERLIDRLGVVSNFYGNLAAVCDDAKVSRYFDVIVDSVAVGWEKPDPRIFRAALDQLELPTAVVTFVGDSARRDMLGAKTVGMPHIWLRAEGSASDAVCCPEDRCVASLGALEGLLL